MPTSRKPVESEVVAGSLRSLGVHVGEAYLKDRYAEPLQRVAGAVVQREPASGRVQAAAVVMDAATLQVLGESRVEAPEGAEVADAEVQALQYAIAALEPTPDLVLVCAHGVSAANRNGPATQVGVQLQCPVIGVALDAETGTSKPLHEMRGAFSQLREDGLQVGWVLRSLVSAPPLVVSPGHHVSMAGAPERVMSFVRSHRLPEPIRIAFRILQG